MKNVIILFLIFFLAKPVFTQPKSSFTDPRDGKEYQIVKIGNYWWMAENMDFDTDTGSWYYNDSENSNGRLYTWETAKKTVIPGWHLPTKEDWEILLFNTDMGDGSYASMNYFGKSGFKSIFTGRYKDDSFSGKDTLSYYWSSTTGFGESAYQCFLSKISKTVEVGIDYQTSALAVRLVKDVSNFPPEFLNYLNPSDGRIGVDISSNTISWDCRDPDNDILTFDIYFGTTENPGLIESDWKETSYLIDTLKTSNIYYWKIIANDPNGDKTSSPVWRFCTDLDHYEGTDSRDGEKYKVFIVGDHYWFYENLNYQTEKGSFTVPGDDNGSEYGRLYTWEAAMSACPPGTHLPSDKEWEEYLFVQGDINPSYNGPGPTDGPGYRSVDGNFKKTTAEWTGYWTSTTTSPYTALSQIYLSSYIGNEGGLIEKNRQIALSVRCVSNSKSKTSSIEYPFEPYDPGPSDSAVAVSLKTQLKWTCSDPNEDKLIYDIYLGTSKETKLIKKDYELNTYEVDSLKPNTLYFWNVLARDEKGHQTSSKIWRFNTAYSFSEYTDSRDRKIYKTIKIGNQVWMAENLKYDAPGNNDWCYDNKSKNCKEYGKLYTWETAQNVCPDGWHLPSKEEWEILIEPFGDNPDEFLTAEGLRYKKDSDLRAKNIYGFSALLPGFRSTNKEYYGIGTRSYFWTSTGYDDGTAYKYCIRVSQNYDSNNKNMGFSVRCIKD